MKVAILHARHHFGRSGPLGFQGLLKSDRENRGILRRKESRRQRWSWRPEQVDDRQLGPPLRNQKMSDLSVERIKLRMADGLSYRTKKRL
jgi:hypothetical protein